MDLESLPESLRTFGTLLRVASDALTEGVYGRLGEAGFSDLRPAHGAVFRHIPPAGSRATELAARAGMRKQSMAFLLDDLKALGYVEDTPDPDDRRARIVRLTERGREAQETLTRLSAEWETGWAERLGRTDWATTRRTLQRLRDTLEEDDREAGRTGRSRRSL